MGRELKETLEIAEKTKKEKNKSERSKETETVEDDMARDRRREAKLKRKADEESNGDGGGEVVGGVEANGEESKKKKKKKKRKGVDLDRSSAVLEVSEIIGEEEVLDEDESLKKRKKKKKEKKVDSSEEFEAPEVVNGAEDREKAVVSNGRDSKAKERKEEKLDQNGVLDGLDEVGEDVKGVIVYGNDVKESKYKPLSSFVESKLPEKVLQCCNGFSKPSPIQSHAWPFLLDGRDLIGIAKTGSGKTLAFGIPALMHVLCKKKQEESGRACPRCFVLSPTRELAQQIADVLCEAGKSCGVKSICLFGGTSKGPQIQGLKSGVDIVIGTPGRVKDLIESGHCHLSKVSYVVLDEADRMLDMGFEPEVRSILSHTCPVRQMVMFSATWPPAVHNLAQEFMSKNIVKVVVGSEDLTANHDVMQIVEVIDDRSRDARLIALLEKYHKSQRGWKAVSVHGDKTSGEGRAPIIITSKRKSGANVQIGSDSVATGFELAGELVNLLREAGQVVPEALTKFGTHVKKKESKLYGAHFKEIKEDAPKATKITFDDSD
ncbi:hypothetical protein Sjap_004119 [Stephania japonica]|uniref:Helicase ATP-binding domain-containing protein n=1 Tax=Stephania japonica TaxID=461633 RepID=A0AAP0K1Y8_9MAGN